MKGKVVSLVMHNTTLVKKCDLRNDFKIFIKEVLGKTFWNFLRLDRKDSLKK